jgi:hypothetical protein
MEHLLNQRFFEIAKEYSVNNPDLPESICFEKANSFLDYYEKLLMKEGKIAYENYKNNKVNSMDLKNDNYHKNFRLATFYSNIFDEFKKVYKDNFLYLHEKKHINFINF